MAILAPGAAVLSLAGVPLPSQIGAGNGPSGSPNLQAVNLAFGNAGQTFLGNKPGIATGSFGFNAAPLRQSIGTVLAALMGTTPFAAQIGFVGGGTEGVAIAAALCQDWTLSASTGQAAASFSGTLRYWAAEASPSTPSAITVLPTDLIDGITMSAVTLLVGSHPNVRSVSCGMRRTFTEEGRATSGFSAVHLVNSTQFFVTVEVFVGDGVTERTKYTVDCPSVGGITVAFTTACIPTGDSAAAGVTLAFSNMTYDRAPTYVGNVQSVSATSADNTSAVTLT